MEYKIKENKFFKEFVDNVERMNVLYNGKRFIQAEQLRDELSERLDDIMRIETDFYD